MPWRRVQADHPFSFRGGSQCNPRSRLWTDYKLCLCEIFHTRIGKLLLDTSNRKRRDRQRAVDEIIRI
jgi:hypothetical protein